MTHCLFKTFMEMIVFGFLQTPENQKVTQMRT